MNDLLSILVPVHNAEATLPGQIARLLDVLPDLTGWFEVVIIDDASTDHTVELVRELSALYPQVRLIRHREHRGLEAAVRTGRQWAQGRTIIVQQNAARFSLDKLRQLIRPPGSVTGPSRTDPSHAVMPPHMFSSFLRHLKNLALGE